jgi:FKBP-type peptidyl-prolyl cis-trans isomerase 2
MEQNESKTTKVPANEAYGPHREELVLQVDRKQFPTHINPEVGQQLRIPQPDGRSVMVRVTHVSEASVTLDANHPLAGKDLTFNIELVEVA